MQRCDVQDGGLESRGQLECHDIPGSDTFGPERGRKTLSLRDDLRCRACTQALFGVKPKRGMRQPAGYGIERLRYGFVAIPTRSAPTLAKSRRAWITAHVIRSRPTRYQLCMPHRVWRPACALLADRPASALRPACDQSVVQRLIDELLFALERGVHIQ